MNGLRGGCSEECLRFIGTGDAGKVAPAVFRGEEPKEPVAADRPAGIDCNMEALIAGASGLGDCVASICGVSIGIAVALVLAAVWPEREGVVRPGINKSG
ncbi:MAG TPA: hypothetical protein VGI46_15620 [Candidatus Acidoferrum sp.]